jgi:hypothetical protein
MNLKKLIVSVTLLLIAGIIPGITCYSQSISNTKITGTVSDSKTGDTLPFATVVLENTSVGTLADINGNYSIVTTATSYKIIFSFVGYETGSQVVFPGKTQVVNIKLNPTAFDLNEVVVKPSKQSYRNKGNPAVELIDKVIENKGANRMDDLDFYKYNKYEKIAFSINNLKKDFAQSKVFNKFPILLDNIDTSMADGKKSIPIFIKETQSDFYYRKSPKSEKEIVKAENNVKFDEYIDNKGLTANIKYLYQDIDIYKNDIFFLSNKFLSPVASTAPVFYRYFIIDTSMVEDVKCYQIFFEPRNPSELLFHGFLFITADSSYAIRKIDMSFNKKINIDWIKDVRIIQDFDKIQGKAWVLKRDNISVDFGIAQNVVGMYGQREVFYNNYSINVPFDDAVFRGPDKTSMLNESINIPEYWDSTRVSPLTPAEKDLFTIVDSVKEIPAFKRRMDVVMLLSTNFLNVGKFEFGSVATFYSYNPFEGSRIKFGGRTTYEFSKRFYVDSYLAYGFKDEQYKYNLGLTYSLSGNSIYKFPVKSIGINYKYDTETPGQYFQYTSQDNFLLSFKRGVDDKIFYNRSFSMEYLNEFENHMSYTLGYNYTRQTPAGRLAFATNESLPIPHEVPYLNISEFYLNLRYAPREEFYQGKLYRSPIASKYPSIQLQSTIGSRNFNNDYNYQKIKFGISKRFYLSILGYTDVSAETGKIFGKVSYPHLFIHNANQTYSYQKNSYNMMNFLEFASDRYVALNIDHSSNGFFFNKVPVLKKFKLREVMTYKMLYGGVSRLNNPDYNPDLFRFPTDINGYASTFTLGQKPYVEASVGIANIFKVMRIDVIKRFTYLNNPNVSSIGVRVQFRIDI